MEYQGEGWTNADSNSVYAQGFVQAEEHPVCPVCGMAVDPATAPKTTYNGRTYFFMNEDHKQQFEANPQAYVDAVKGK
jgi:YHS domain-containing protein